MEEVEHLATTADPLLTCCLCRRLLQDAVRLACLHNCCRRCFSTVALNGNSQDIMCGWCSTISHSVTEQPNSFIDFLVQRHMSIGEPQMCAACINIGVPNKPAEIWCQTCRHTLCRDCIATHNKYYIPHIMQSLDMVGSLEEMFPPLPTVTCPVHNKPQDIVCITCEMPKCIRCWAQCREMKHEMHVGLKPLDNYVEKFITRISFMESEVLRKAKVLEKPKRVVADVKRARARHLELINQRKRRIVEAVNIAYQEIECLTKDAYNKLQEECDVVAADADRIASNLSYAQNYIHRLVESNNNCEILKQQKVVRQRLRALSAELDSLSGKLMTTMRTLETNSSLPDDLENVVRSWIGMPLWHSGCLEAPALQLKTVRDQSSCAAGPRVCTSISQSRWMRCSAAAQAHDCLKRDFGYEFKGGMLVDTKSGRRFEFKSQDEYEQIGMVVNEYVYGLLEEQGLQLRLLERRDSAAPPRGFFFASKDVDTNANGILVLIHGTGAVRAGQWSRSLIINQSVESGSQLPYIQEAKKRNWSVVVMNTNQNNDSYNWCQHGKFFAGYDPEDHGVRVWKAVIDHSPARHVAIVAHSYGGHVTSCLLRKMGSAFKKKVVAIALTDSYCSVVSSDQDYFRKVARNWVASKLPVGDSVGYALDCERVSAGTTVHEETSWKSMTSVFAFIEKKFLAAASDSKTAASRHTTETQC